MYSVNFKERFIELRNQKSVTAREMSLSLGFNDGYINTIESGKALPSMANFFYICEYLNVTPAEFFQTDVELPEQLKNLIEDLKRLDRKQLDTISNLANTILGK